MLPYLCIMFQLLEHIWSLIITYPLTSNVQHYCPKHKLIEATWPLGFVKKD